MALSKPLELANGKYWPARKFAHAHFKEMLSRHHDGQRVADPQDHSDLSALLQRYDQARKAGAPSKVGVGIEYFSREKNHGDGWSTSGFHVHRTDGSSVDFSYVDAVMEDVKL